MSQPQAVASRIAKAEVDTDEDLARGEAGLRRGVRRTAAARRRRRGRPRSPFGLHEVELVFARSKAAPLLPMAARMRPQFGSWP